MRSLIRAYPTETRLFAVLSAICVFLSFASDSFLTLPNFPRCSTTTRST